MNRLELLLPSVLMLLETILRTRVTAIVVLLVATSKRLDLHVPIVVVHLCVREGALIDRKVDVKEVEEPGRRPLSRMGKRFEEENRVIVRVEEEDAFV